MALATGSAIPDRQPTPSSSSTSTSPVGLTLNLSSNNPFRNRAVSPALASPLSFEAPSNTTSSDQAPPSLRGRMSKNPFLDDSEVPAGRSNAPSNNGVNVPSDIFNDLSLLDKPADAPARRGPPPPYPSQGPLRSATMQANGGAATARGLPRGPDSPSRRDPAQPRRPRGQSESSITDRERLERREKERERGDKPPRTESEERRRRERRKERDERHRREKEKVRKGGDNKMRRPQGLDIIDKLDVTGIYGQGLFHHDGPFDACNPHRNAKKDRRAPMQAFPVGSANMALGGAGPLNSQLDLDRFHGRGEEAFDTFSRTRRADTAIIDPTMRVDPIHGDETSGLGTSTFLEGAPASKRDLQRRDSDDREKDPMMGGGFGPGAGLSRKKSLAQRIRGMSSGRPQRPTDLRTPDERFDGEVFDASPSYNPANKSVSAGGPSRAVYTRDNEVNPFDNDYENAYEKKGAQIKIAEQERSATGRARAPSSPRGASRGLARTMTADSADVGRPGSNDGEGNKTGFLNRMRSLKGGRRARPEGKES